MNGLTKSLAAGFAGALATNALHEALRRAERTDTPRVDLLGMQALTKLLTVLTGCGKTPGAVSNPPVPPKASSLFGHNATALLPHRSSFRRNIRVRSGHRGFFRNLLKLPRPTGTALYRTTLAADLASNSLYFALIGAAPPHRSLAAGAVLGLAAGCGAVILSPRLGLDARPTNRSTFTQMSTVGLYAVGGLVAALSGGLSWRTRRASQRMKSPTIESVKSGTTTARHCGNE